MDRFLNSSWRKNATENDTRRKQIESLFSELPSLRSVASDESRFQLTLHLSDGAGSNAPHSHLQRTSSSPAASKSTMDGQTSGSRATATLFIYLPPAFPEEEPKITVQPTVRHLWVDGTVQPAAVTGHERLMPGGWSAHANLGRIVKEIADTLQWTGVLVGDQSASNSGNVHNDNQANNSTSGTKVVYEEYSSKPPPPIPGNRSKSLGQTNQNSYSNTNGHSSINSGAGGNFNKATSSSTHHQTGTHSSTMGGYGGQSAEARIIMELPAEKVDELLESPVAFQHFVDHLELVTNSRTLKREWWLGNDNVARRNLALEAEVADLQQSTVRDHREAARLQKLLEEKLQQQQDALWRFKPETLQSKMRAAVAESEELSESIAQSFLEGKLDQEGFIRQYRDLRKVYHLREMKNERLGSILRNNPPPSVLTPASGGASNLLTGGSSSSTNGSGPGGGTDTRESWVML